jgi:hypothetical protein
MLWAITDLPKPFVFEELEGWLEYLSSPQGLGKYIASLWLVHPGEGLLRYRLHTFSKFSFFLGAYILCGQPHSMHCLKLTWLMSVSLGIWVGHTLSCPGLHIPCTKPPNIVGVGWPTNFTKESCINISALKGCENFCSIVWPFWLCLSKSRMSCLTAHCYAFCSCPFRSISCLK